MSNILITSIGSASAESIISSLSRDNYIVGTNIYEKDLIYASSLVNDYHLVPKSSDPRFIPAIIDICKKYHIEYVMPLTDVEVDALNLARNAFSELGITICLSSYECICLCRDKKRLSRLIKKKNICEVPKEITDKNEIIKFPIICKKINGRSSQDKYELYDIEAYDYAQKKYGNEEYIYQEFIEGNVITVDTIKCGRDIVSLSREEYIRTVNGLGVAVKTFEDNRLKEIVEKISVEINICGCVNYEFIKASNGDYYFLECNPRFSGGVNFSKLSGYDFARNQLNCFKRASIENLDSFKPHTLVKQYMDIVVE